MTKVSIHRQCIFVMPTALAILLFLHSSSGQVAPIKDRKPDNSNIWRKLKIIETKTIQGQPSLGMIGQQRCDTDGNIYFQPSDGVPVFGPLAYKIDTRELKLVAFRVDQLPELRVAEPGGFSVAPDGTFYFEVRSNPEPRKPKSLFIVKFDKDGSYKNKTRIEGFSYTPDQLVPFAHGEFLIGGRGDSSGSPVRGHVDVPFTAVFDSSGVLVRKVQFEQDKEIMKAAYGDSENPRKLSPDGFRGVDLGSATVGRDGLAYLMRYGLPVVIYGIDSGGSVEKKISVTPPEPGLYPASLIAFDGGFVIRFLDFRNKDVGRLYKVVDLNGEEIETFDGSTLPSAFGCYSRENNRFTFISSKDKQMAVAFAEPE